MVDSSNLIKRRLQRLEQVIFFTKQFLAKTHSDVMVSQLARVEAEYEYQKSLIPLVEFFEKPPKKAKKNVKKRR